MKSEKNTAIFVAYDDSEPFDPSAPERSLLRALLLGALYDLKKPGEPHRRAMEYLLSPEDDYIFSFQSICNFLEIDPKRFLVYAGLKQPSPKSSEDRAVQ